MSNYHQSTVINMYANVHIGVTIQKLHQLSDDRITREMLYLTTHSTHVILRLYGVGHMVKDHADSERGNPLPPHGLLFPINSIPQTGYHILCYTSRGALAGTKSVTESHMVQRIKEEGRKCFI